MTVIEIMKLNGKSHSAIASTTCLTAYNEICSKAPVTD